MTLPKLPAMPPGETIDGRKLFTSADMREFANQHGRACFDAGMVIATSPLPNSGQYSSAVNDLMGILRR